MKQYIEYLGLTGPQLHKLAERDIIKLSQLCTGKAPYGMIAEQLERAECVTDHVARILPMYAEAYQYVKRIIDDGDEHYYTAYLHAEKALSVLRGYVVEPLPPRIQNLGRFK